MMPRYRNRQTTFHGVLHNIDDQVIVRELVEQVLTDKQKEAILRAFNADVDRYNGIVNRQIIEQHEKALTWI